MGVFTPWELANATDQGFVLYCLPGEQVVKHLSALLGEKFISKKYNEGLPGGAVVENLPANAGNTGSSPGLGRSHMPRSN